MIQIIHGKKGSGKTKKLLDLAIQTVKTAAGDVVFVDDDTRYMYDLPHEIRFVNAGEYGVDSPEMFLGFLCGMLTQNFDISVVFVDAFMKLVKVPAEQTEAFFNRLDAISAAHNVQFIISASVDDTAAPEFLKKYFLD
ncbi:MAG: twitching motility protein PilT [Clostridia bacterium]|nr:twitching motility protein PilT [Clostridia bacterium]